MKIDFFNPRSIILFICILQGVVFAALLSFRGRRDKSPADNWLAVVLLVMCSGLITAFIGFASVYNAYQWLTFFPFELVFALAPSIYLYVLSLTNSERPFTRRDLLHFIPAALYVAYRLVLFSQDIEFKNWYDDNIQVPVAGPLQNVIVFAWNAAYLYLSIRHYYRYREWLNQNYSNTGVITFNWLRNFLILFAFLMLLSAAFDLTNSFITTLSYRQVFYYEVILALLTYYLAIAGYLRTGTIRPSFEPVANPEIAPPPEVKPPSRRREAIAAADLPAHKEQLTQLMLNEKPYLEPDLSLTDLARKMALNTAALSYLINTGFGRNFNDFVNEYRIEEFKRLMKKRGEHVSLLGVAFDCGFNSKATFNRAFRKITGVAPTEFER